jgi:molybdate transport system substrate-binding protein
MRALLTARPRRHGCLLALLLALVSLRAAPLRAEEITVSAAASLSNAFREMASAFQAEHAEVEVLLNFAPSDALLQQLGAGAPIDVLATADGETMDKAVERKLVAPATRRDFAANNLVMVTPADSALGLTALADLTQPAVKRIALGNPAGVPAGRYAQGALQQAGLWPLPTGKAVYAQSVRQALDYVARGEVEAGFVYATDARMHADKVKVALDAPTDQAIIYPLAVTRDSRNKDSAAAFIAFVMSAKGQAVLARFGFKAP